MRKLTIVLVGLMLLPQLGAARGNHPMAGCGLGYLLLSNRDNDKVTQVIGATTNGTFGSQTFGISSGTSGCTEDGAVKLARATAVFAEVNLDPLRAEMAAGQGEYAEAFASLLGATDETRPQMLRFFQAEYRTLFPSAGTTSDEMLTRLADRLARHPELIG